MMNPIVIAIVTMVQHGMTISLSANIILIHACLTKQLGHRRKFPLPADASALREYLLSFPMCCGKWPSR